MAEFYRKSEEFAGIDSIIVNGRKGGRATRRKSEGLANADEVIKETLDSGYALNSEEILEVYIENGTFYTTPRVSNEQIEDGIFSSRTNLPVRIVKSPRTFYVSGILPAEQTDIFERLRGEY